MHNAMALPLDGDPASMSDESALILAARHDAAAFGTLYLRYLDRVYWYLRARTPNEDDAADLTQQVFLHALAALPRYRQQSVPFAAWLFRIARNVAIDFSRRRRATVAWDALPDGARAGALPDLESTAMQAEAFARLRTLLARLDTEKRELLALRFAAGLTVAEIATVIGKSEAATKKQLTRLVQSLKEQYHDPS